MSTTISCSKTSRRLRSVCFCFIIFVTSIAAIASQSGSPQGNALDPLIRQRRLMVERDLRGRGIKDTRVLNVMESLPRHLFVPEPLWSAAYADHPLAIGEGQTISQPYIVAFMTELLKLKGREKVLEIGTGSGYQTAVLARLAAEVFSIEILPALSQRAESTLARIGVANVHLKVGDGYFGWAENAPYDAILVTAAAAKVPQPLWRQLREGGRLVMPLGEQGGAQRLVRWQKLAGKAVAEDFTGVVFVPLTGVIQEKGRPAPEVDFSPAPSQGSDK